MEKKLKVELIEYTPNPDTVIATSARMCYNAYDLADLRKEMESRDAPTIIRFVMDRGHQSVIEHASYTFAIEGVSRALSHQLVRHRLASFSQQSQRYVDMKNPNYIVPDSIERIDNPEINEKYADFFQAASDFYTYLREHEIPAEDARYVLPNGTETKIIVTMNARELLHFFNVRLCFHAQWEIRRMTEAMLELVEPTSTVFEYAGPNCYRDGICPEGRSGCIVMSKHLERKSVYTSKRDCDGERQQRDSEHQGEENNGD